MDGLMMTENPDTSTYAKQLAEKTAEESDPLKELIYEMVSMLPEEDQDLYRMYYTEGYSQEEIAEMKGVSQNTVSKKLRRIKKQLTEMCRKAV
jgi:RNA polymerase sigma factor (sigma-70 family)